MRPFVIESLNIRAILNI